MKEYLLGIDLGTSGTKTVLFRSDGTAMAAHTVEYPSTSPRTAGLSRSRPTGGVPCRRRCRPCCTKAVWPPPILPV